jgi:hypothetical protein
MEGATVASLLAGIILPTPHTSPQEQITLHHMMCSLCALPELSKEFNLLFHIGNSMELSIAFVRI